jgi:hypothetical protein
MIWVSAAISVIVVVATIWRLFLQKKEVWCCEAARADESLLNLEGVSAFGDVIECCKACGARLVYQRVGRDVTRMHFTADEWRLLRGKVPTEGFRSAHRVAARARGVRGKAPEREASGREREQHLREGGCDPEDD